MKIKRVLNMQTGEVTETEMTEQEVADAANVAAAVPNPQPDPIEDLRAQLAALQAQIDKGA